ncbi:MAG: hypothetical protein K6E40_13450 [Desulfovibrio sp.]|nr:hypothetical protein [Desulfovibrio sp.]
MNRNDLQAVIRGLYASFGRRDPGDVIIGAAADAVPADAGDDFPAYAADAMAALERLPNNIGRWLARVIFPQYVAERIVATGNSDCGRPGCPECGGTGWHEVWHAGAAPGTAPTALPCVCNCTIVAWTQGRPCRHTRCELERAGWTFEAPASVAGPGRPISRERYDRKRASASSKATDSVPAGNADSHHQ